jgi:hypothetical protein
LGALRWHRIEADPGHFDWTTTDAVLGHRAPLADAAMTSATPSLRAPLLGRISAVLVLHPPAGGDDGVCPTCGTTSPCRSAQVLQW